MTAAITPTGKAMGAVWHGIPARLAPIMAFGCIAATAIAMRLGQIGNPVAGLDDQFYLLVGDRLWSGLLPYTDIWDRKPAGLFYLYGAIRALPGDGVVAYQLVATASLVMTGIGVARIGMAVLPVRAALASGLAVIAYGVLLGAGFGEAPIFYDLLIVSAGARIVAIVERPAPGDRIDRRALLAMLLCGVALTLKTSAIFESGAFGLLLVRHDRSRPPATRVRNITIYLALGVLPTAITALPYLVHGGIGAFIFANFRSAFLRGGGTGVDSVARGVATLLLLSPLVLLALAEWRGVASPRRQVLTAWTVAGVMSFIAIGHCFQHYALPLVTPLALLGAYGVARRAVAVPIFALLAVVIGTYSLHAGAAARRDEADVAALTAALPSSVRTGCLFVYEGPTILYHLSGACLPGRYVFPGHFTEPTEEGALERPMAAILRETLSHRPAVIVSAPGMRGGGRKTANDLILDAELARAYRPIARRPIYLYGDRPIETVVWARRQRKL